MKTMRYCDAADSALAQAMAKDFRIICFGEDVRAIRRNLYVRFGGERVRNTPISESAFVGAAVTASMAGLRPVVDIYMVDFLGVAMDALLNHAAKVRDFSGGNWHAPLVVRAPFGGGYGDGGQHEQSLWGWLAHIPGLAVVVPSNPVDAGGLMLAALEYEDPVIFMESKLMSETWLDFLGGGSRENLNFDIPGNGAMSLVPDTWEPIPFGKAAILREGTDVTIVSLGVGVHRALEAAEVLAQEEINTEVIDLRTVSPLDIDTFTTSLSKTGRLLVVDEDYHSFGLSGELAALALEEGINCKYARVCTEGTIPFNREMEDAVLPNVDRIVDVVKGFD